MQYEVQVREVAPQLMAAARGQGNWQTFLPRLFALLDEVWKFLRANPSIQHEGINVFYYVGDDSKGSFRTEQGIALEAGVKITAPFESGERVVCSATPGGIVATVTHIGPYEKLIQAHTALRQWCQQNGRSLAGPNWEVYGHWNEDPAQLRTDIFYLLK